MIVNHAPQSISHLNLQDINSGNMLINQFMHDSACGFWDLEARAHLRAGGQVRYCLFDFDLSQVFPLDTPVTDSRLPTTSVKERGTPWLHPKEVNSADPDLDLFKFDVPCMENMLSDYKVRRFLITHYLDHLIQTNDPQCMIPLLPLLATLLDRMTTDDVANRFTAFQALSFCRLIQNILTPTELDQKLLPRTNSSDIETRCGVWELLPVNFVRKWSIGGLGWVRVFDNFLHLLTNSENARLKPVKYTKAYCQK
jgi:serine/threonine protein kinase